jgi:hypothetical protein
MNSLKYIIMTTHVIKNDGARLHRLTLHLNTTGTVDALAGEV